MTEKWFRFRTLDWGKVSGKMDNITEIFAPTMAALKRKVTPALVENGGKFTFSYIDRVKVEISGNGKVTFSNVILKNAMDGNRLFDEIEVSNLYKRLLGEKEMAVNIS